MNNKIKGLATMEVLFAVILLTGIILILMRTTSSSNHYTNASNKSRDYAIMINDVLHQYTSEVSDCQAADSESNCDLTTASNKSSNNYLSNMSSSATDTLQDAGIDPSDIKVTVCWTRMNSSCA